MLLTRSRMTACSASCHSCALLLPQKSERSFPCRDFFQFMHLKQRGAHPSEWVATHPPELQDMSPADIFQRWCRGETGFPFVDASMRELAATGYMSNRSRQNVASILAKASTQQHRPELLAERTHATLHSVDLFTVLTRAPSW